MHTLSSDWCYYEHWWECIRSHLTGATMSVGENAYALIWLVLLSSGENAYALIWLVLLWALVRMHRLSSDWCYYEHWWECIHSHLTSATMSSGENAYAHIWLVLLWALVRMHMLSSDWCYYERWWECICSHLTGSMIS